MEQLDFNKTKNLLNKYGLKLVDYRVISNRKDIEKLSLEEQNEKLKTELKAIIFEKQELLRHTTFLQSQISKYQNIQDGVY